MKRIWVINHYATHPSQGTFVRQYYFAKNLIDKLEMKMFVASAIHNASLNFVEPGKKIVSKDYDGIQFNYLKTSSYDNNGFKRMLNMIQFAVRILFIPESKFGKPDIIYASSPNLFSTFTSVFLARRYQAKLLVEIRDIWPWSIAEYSSSITINHPVIRFLSFIEKWIYKKADAIIFTMAGGRDYIRDRGWSKEVDLNKVFHINNGIDLDQFELRPPNQEGKNTIIKLVYAGSLRSANDVLGLVKTMQSLSNEYHLSIYGGGSGEEEIRSFINENEIDNISLMGRVAKSDIPKILEEHDATIMHYKTRENSLLNKYGSSQNKLFEYLASGKPVLSNQEFGFDIINSNHCGIAKDCQSPEEFAEVITKLRQIPMTEYNEICNNCLTTAKRYDWKILSQDFEQIVEQLEI